MPIPPLRERSIEVPALANYFLEKCGREWGKTDLRLSEETVEYLALYRWPGNVRQLANQMRRMVALAESGAGLTRRRAPGAVPGRVRRHRVTAG